MPTHKKQKIAAFVQARMGSTRLPGKVMLPVLGRPLLSYLIERLQRAKKLDMIAVVTSNLTRDDVIAEWCRQHSVLCFRGPEEDVLARFAQAAAFYEVDSIVRITADCPLLDPSLIDEMVDNYLRDPSVDYFSNTLERTYPRGLDVEIFSKQALDIADKEARTPYEREHVTPYFYGHPERFSLKNMKNKSDLSALQWTVDTPEDFARIAAIFEALYPQNPYPKFNDCSG